MITSNRSVQFSGWPSSSPKKRLAKSVKQAEQEAANAAQRAKDEKLEKERAKIREALGQTLFTDSKGDFQGWHLLQLIQKSKDAKIYTYGMLREKKPIKGTANLSTLEKDFTLLKAEEAFKQMVRKLEELDLIEKHIYSSFLKITERGHQVLKTFKQDVKSAGLLSQKRGTYTVQDEPS